MKRPAARRLDALEAGVFQSAWRFPTLADWYAGRDRDGDAALSGETIRLAPGSVSWSEFYAAGRHGVTGAPHQPLGEAGAPRACT
jgi:hypothetical protein